MLTLKKCIADSFVSLFNEQLDFEQIKLENTNPDFEGNFTFVVFPYLRVSKKKPEETAQLIGEFVKAKMPEIQAFNVVKGFLNFSFSEKFWIGQLSRFNSANRLGKTTDNPEKIMVEYSSPNTNKPLHLGHVRNNLLGYSICQILEYYGHDVMKVNLVNDRGIHICKSMLAYQHFGNGETPEIAGMKGDHLIGKYYVMFDKLNRDEAAQLVAEGMDEEKAKMQTTWMKQASEMLEKWEQGDAETVALWKKMNEWVYDGFEVTYKRMGVQFDKFYYESNTYLLGKEIVEEGLAKKVFYRKPDGSVWIDLTADGLDEKLLLRANGTSVYMTQDMGTADLKYADFPAKQSVYVVGNEQDYHFKVLQLILQKLGRPYADGIYHKSYGMVELPTGKLKTREGKVVDADDLMDEMYETAKTRTAEQGKTDGLSENELDKLYETLGMGALKYFLLKVDPTKKILFNPAESVDFQGNTGTFIQYTHARCQSILSNVEVPSELRFDGKLEKVEQDLMVHFFQFDTTLEEAARQMSPAVIAQYLYDTAKLYNTFYNQCSILRADTQEQIQLRIALTNTTAKMLRVCGKMLGIVMPERM
ncbi:MAG: arginine--tRNA ligase [Flavobacteriales bacterium]|nr:arginine--tRNA ligase [Flavobacteriales bacterium]